MAYIESQNYVVLQEATDQYRGLASAADACVCMLRILTMPGLKRELIAEDHVEAVLAFLKFHLSANALAFADARLCRQYRPDINDIFATGTDRALRCWHAFTNFDPSLTEAWRAVEQR